MDGELATLEQLVQALDQVGIDEFQNQETQFEEDSRLGRELLYLNANDQWIRATREIVTLNASDFLDTRLNIHVDLGRITHEAFRNRPGRLWLPLAVLPPARASEHPVRRIVPTPTVRDADGRVLPSLPQSEARRWMAAALAEILLNMIATAVPAADVPALLREHRLLLSAALFRVLRESADPAQDPTPGYRSDLHRDLEPGGAGRARLTDGRRDGTVELARSELHDLLHVVSRRLDSPAARPGADRGGLLCARALRVVQALRAPTSLVVLGVDPTRTAGVYQVEIVGRPLNVRGEVLPRLAGPRARIDLDVLLPGTEADHAVIVDLPEGLAFGGHGRAASVDAEVTTRRPPVLAQVDTLAEQLAGTGTPTSGPDLPEPALRCLVDLSLARIEAARDTFRYYRATLRRRRGRITRQGLGADGVPAYLSRYRQQLRECRDVEDAAAFTERARAAAATYLQDRVTDRERFPVFERVTEAATVSPHRAHVRLPGVENRDVRATPSRAQVHLFVRADAAVSLYAARRAGLLSLVLLTALVLFEQLTGKPPAEVDALATLLTLFAAIQATWIESPDRSTLRGVVVGLSAWIVVASVLPPVLLGIALVFGYVDSASLIALAAQVAVQAAMFLPTLTGRSLLSSTPFLRLGTGAALDHERTDVLHAGWWRSTTAGALLLGTSAHAFVIPQTGVVGMRDLLDPVGQRTPPPGAARTGVLRSLLRRPAPDPGNGTGSATGSATGNGTAPEGPALDPQPANILAMLRAGTHSSTLTFVVFREEPEATWFRDTRHPVYLDVDRLNVTELPVANVDVHLGLPAADFQPLDGHPLDRLLEVAGERGSLVLDTQFPAPPPPGGDPARFWARLRIGLRDDEVRGVSGLAAAIHAAVPQTASAPPDLLVDMSPQAPPRWFRGRPTTAVQQSLRPLDLDVARSVPKAPQTSPPGTDPGWISVAAYDYVRPGVEHELVSLIRDRHPGALLSGLSTARLHGVAMVFVLARRVGRPPARPLNDRRILLENVVSTADLGRFPPTGVLLRVAARYSDRTRLFADLLDELARGFGDIAQADYRAPELQLAYIHTEVADGRNVVTRFMVVLPGADPARFTADELGRVERAARRMITRGHVEAVVDDPGSAAPGPKALVRLSPLTRPPEREIDLRDAAPVSRSDPGRPAP